MCYNCGCHSSTDDMGDKDNITEDTLKKLGKKLGGMPLKETKLYLFNLLEKKFVKKEKIIESLEIKEMFEKAALAWGQPVPAARESTYKLLKTEISKLT